MTQDDNYFADRGISDIKGGFKISADGVAQVSKAANLIADAVSYRHEFISSAHATTSPAASPIDPEKNAMGEYKHSPEEIRHIRNFIQRLQK